MKTLPTFGVIPAINALMELAKAGKQAPGLKYGLDRLLHGEQYLELKRPLPTHGKLTHKSRISNIYDKGKNAVVVNEVITYDEDGNLLTTTMATYLVPSAAELPSYETDRTETESPTNPLGVKGVGETGTIAAAPAVINALLDALSHLGVTDIQMPATPERVWRAIQEAKP